MAATNSNLLLDALPPSVRRSLLAEAEAITLPVGSPVFDPAIPPKYGHFVTSGIVSVVDYLEDGDGVEVGLIGHEGLVEALHLLGEAKSPTTGFVQVEGTALRLPFEELRRQFLACTELREVILAYVQRLGYTLTQLAACNRLHEVEPRMARWLLMVQDRVGENTFMITQEFLADMIGARRTTVTLAAHHLREAGLIHYSRGKMHILDRHGLEQVACECYRVMRDLARIPTPVGASDGAGGGNGVHG